MKGIEQHLAVRLRAVWRRELLLNLAAGTLAFCRWGILLFLAGMAIDWTAHLPALLRVVILVSLLAVSGYRGWRAGWRRLRAFNATHTALRIEEHLGGLESLLVTAVQLRDRTSALGTSESLRAATCRRAEEAVAPLRPDDAVRFHGLRRPAQVALALALMVAAIGALNGPFLAAGVARIFAPWLPVSYPTFTQLELASGDLIVKEGSPVSIEASVSGIIPKQAELALRTDKGKPRRRSLPITNGGCEYHIRTAFRSFEYRIIAGDARSEWQSVEVIRSPRIDRAEVTLEFPEYTERPAETVEALTVTVPEGTRIKWQLTLDQAVSSAGFNLDGQQSLPFALSADGLSVTMQAVATESRAYSFSWVEKAHGFSFTSPSHYLQVAPDRPPRVEITKPRRNLYATLGRKLELAFRGRDDHGIGELAVGYRVNKTEEGKVLLPTPPLGDGEQSLNWDYRTVLTNLVVGDTVSFVIELADRYPGVNGPHRARSQGRRLSFLSKEDYLAQIEQQKQRLFRKLLGVYREEREVHDVVRNLNPADDVFAQTCQLEAVRQDLMRERLSALGNRMGELVADLAANGIANISASEVLVQLRADLQSIADDHVGSAAAGLRALGVSANNVQAGGVPDPAPAVRRIDSAARELGYLLLQVGFREAAEAMARELHAAARAQAYLRARTIMERNDGADLSAAQRDLGRWVTRLLGAAPGYRESTVEDALVAFNLSLLTKNLQKLDVVSAKMSEAAASISKAEFDAAARLQADVIKALLHAEFRLRLGAEYEALDQAGDLYMSQARDQKTLREESAALTREAFSKRRSDIAQAEAGIIMKLHSLLMPFVPAPRPRLFDVEVPPAPAVYDLLAVAEGAMEKAVSQIGEGDRDAAAKQQQRAETAFEGLAAIVRERKAALTQGARLRALILFLGECTTKTELFAERQTALIEKTEDAAADKADSEYLTPMEQRLAADVQKFRGRVGEARKAVGVPSEDFAPLLGCLDRTVRSMTDAVSSLRGNRSGEAIAYQEKAHVALTDAASLVAEYQAIVAPYASTLADAAKALKPGPYVADILSEQGDLIAAMPKAKPADLPRLAIAQKNLIHAVNAVLGSLDVLADKVESGTVMLFAKEDMDAAGTALAENDLEEATDAATAVEESLEDLKSQLDAIAPRYSYILEVEEALYESMPTVSLIHAAQRQLRVKTKAADAPTVRGLVGEQRTLISKAEATASLLHKVTGKRYFSDALRHMNEVANGLSAGDRNASLGPMTEVAGSLSSGKDELLRLMKLLALVLAPPEPGKTLSPEVKLIQDALAVATAQKVLYRETQAATPEQAAGLAPRQHALAKRCEALIQPFKSHPHVVSARRYLAAAAVNLEASSRAKAITSQQQAGEALRYLILEHVLLYLEVPVPAAPEEDGQPSYDVGDEETFKIFMPGAVSGVKPRGGREDWEVLGRRNRAALNENFARELPLEYRAILKDYYERLAR